MRRTTAAMIAATVALAVLPTDSAPGQTANGNPVTVEYYYRIRWGGMDEFLRLYRKNHEPILRALKAQGWITRIDEAQPFTHMAGGPRWDLRVTLVYRDADAAVVTGGRFDAATEAVTQRLYPDRAKLAAEEQARFALLEDHWDVVVKPAPSE